MSRPPTASGGGGAPTRQSTFVKRGRLNAIPARIRAFVKVIHDIDRDQFPDVYLSVAAPTTPAASALSPSSPHLAPLETSAAAADSTARLDSPTQQSFSQQQKQQRTVEVLNDAAVHALSVAVGREVRTARDWEDFALALEEYSRRLSGVDLATLQRSGLGRLVAMSTAIDREAAHCGLSMATDLSSVFDCHQIVLRVVQTEYLSSHPAIFDIFVERMAEMLGELEAIVTDLSRRRDAAMRRRRGRSARAEAVALLLSGPSSSSPSPNADATTTPASSSSASRQADADRASKAAEEEAEAAAEAAAEKAAALRIVELNSTLEHHVRHMSWFISVSSVELHTLTGEREGEGKKAGGFAERSPSSPQTRGVSGSHHQQQQQRSSAVGTSSSPTAKSAVLFDAREFLNDVSAAEVWCLHVGRHTPACRVEDFLPALAALPEWAHAPILRVLDFRGCGIVSAMGLLRLLDVWGPFLLIDRNIGRDLARGFISLSETTAMAEARLRRLLAEKPPPAQQLATAAAERLGAAAAGGRPPAHAAWTSPTPPPGRNVGGGRPVAGQYGGASPTTAAGRHFHHAEPPAVAPPPRIQRFGLPAGTAVMTIAAERRCAFDLLLVTAKGNIKHLVVDGEGGSWSLVAVSQEVYEGPTDCCAAFSHIFSHPAGEDGATIYAVPPLTAQEAASEGAFSLLHRACFRNNTPYVRRLIECGNALIVNSAVVDPAITSRRAWTPLLAAANNPNGDPYAIAALLLSCGGDGAFADASACTALYYAIVNRYVRTAKVLIAHHYARHVATGRYLRVGQLPSSSPSAFLLAGGGDPLAAAANAAAVSASLTDVDFSSASFAPIIPLGIVPPRKGDAAHGLAHDGATQVNSNSSIAASPGGHTQHDQFVVFSPSPQNVRAIASSHSQAFSHQHQQQAASASVSLASVALPLVPPPVASAGTVPLFVALGAHFYNASRDDNLRLEHCLPDPEVIALLLTCTNDLAVVRAAYEVLHHKIYGTPMSQVGAIVLDPRGVVKRQQLRQQRERRRRRHLRQKDAGGRGVQPILDDDDDDDERDSSATASDASDFSDEDVNSTDRKGGASDGGEGSDVDDDADAACYDSAYGTAAVRDRTRGGRCDLSWGYDAFAKKKKKNSRKTIMSPLLDAALPTARASLAHSQNAQGTRHPMAPTPPPHRRSVAADRELFSGGFGARRLTFEAAATAAPSPPSPHGSADKDCEDGEEKEERREGPNVTGQKIQWNEAADGEAHSEEEEEDMSVVAIAAAVKRRSIAVAAATAAALTPTARPLGLPQPSAAAKTAAAASLAASQWNFAGAACPTLTEDEAAREVAAVAAHSALCSHPSNVGQCLGVLRAIGDHCYLLSARRLVEAARAELLAEKAKRETGSK